MSDPSRLNHPLHAAWVKVQRAYFHVDALHGEMVGFFSQEPDRVVAHYDEQAAGWTMVLSEPLPFTWPSIIGDALQNLRSAMDHIAWACALRFTPTPSTAVSFPITADVVGWNRSRLRIEPRTGDQRVGQDAVDWIKQMQPHFNGTPDPTAHQLWFLNELARVDRHRTTHLTVVEQVGSGYDFGGPNRRGNVRGIHSENPNELRYLLIADRDSDSQDHGFGKMTVSDADGNVIRDLSHHAGVTFLLSFDPNGEVAQGLPVADYLRILCQFVETACVNGAAGRFFP